MHHTLAVCEWLRSQPMLHMRDQLSLMGNPPTRTEAILTGAVGLLEIAGERLRGLQALQLIARCASITLWRPARGAPRG